MTKKRTKVTVESIIKKEEPLKVRSTNKKNENQTKGVVVDEKLENKKITSDNRFERHKAFGDQTKRNEIIEKVKQGLLRWSFYAIDNDNGYHYYLKIKK